MKKRRVRFTATANEQIETERTWWRKNREHQEVLAAELETAVEILAILPGAGTPYVSANSMNVRRIYLRKIGCHLYYSFDDDEVIVRALWGARRKRGPTITA